MVLAAKEVGSEVDWGPFRIIGSIARMCAYLVQLCRPKDMFDLAKKH